jgi:hypothetical protein
VSLSPTAPGWTCTMRGQASVDAAAAALRSLAQKCEIGEAGLRVTTREGRTREVAWSGIGRIVAGQLPPDPPWEAGLLLDIVAHLDGRWEPLRLFTTTLVNFAALASADAGARRRHARARRRAPPARLLSASQLAEYDAVCG